MVHFHPMKKRSIKQMCYDPAPASALLPPFLFFLLSPIVSHLFVLTCLSLSGSLCLSVISPSCLALPASRIIESHPFRDFAPLLDPVLSTEPCYLLTTSSPMDSVPLPLDSLSLLPCPFCLVFPLVCEYSVCLV